MPDESDIALVREYARRNSEPAFAELVQRHIALVYSVALRFTRNPPDAEDVAQAVFVILARKAAGLGAGTILTGWLYETTRLTALQWLRNQARRRHHEQEAYMQSTLDNPNADTVWRHVEPLLEQAMSRLNQTDRTLLALRFYESRTGAETAALLGIGEWAARKRAERALKRLRDYFAKRGVDSTTTAIAESISANSVQAAPVALAKSVTAVALTKGAAASTSTLTIVKGALKIMAWTKAKTAIVIGATVLFTAGTATVVVEKAAHYYSLRQRLPDGSVLVLNKVFFGDKHEFVHGGKKFDWNTPGEKHLVVEFGVSGGNAASNSLVKPAFYRQFRCVIHGETGIDYVEEFWPRGFEKYPDGFFNYVETSIFPRDSKWLWFQVEKSATNNPYGPWQTVADFKVPNPARPANHPWIASPSPTTNAVGQMSFVLGEVTVEQRPYSPRDIWNHMVTVPVKAFDRGVLLTNWGPVYCHTEDASGNYDPVLQRWRSLDPRYVWKMEMDFEPETNFPPESLATVDLPRAGSKITTEAMGEPVTISWDGTWFDASMPTNRTDLGLKFVGATDAQGEKLGMPSGSWSQYGFRYGDFAVQRNGVWNMGNVRPATVTFAVVPSVHTTFYTQPRLVTGKTD